MEALAYAESCDRLSATEYGELLAHSRECYGQADDVSLEVAIEIAADFEAELPVAASDPQPEPPSLQPDVPNAPPSYRKEGGGGARHSEIERQLRELGEAAGFRASLEETILDGAGRVDVILRRDDLTICCEVSVTTTREHELLNVKKCLEFGADQVWLVANSGRHKTGLERFIRPMLTEAESEKTSFLTLEGVEGLMRDLAPTQDAKEKVVRGYRVKSTSNSKSAVASVRNSLNQIIR